MYNFRKKKRDRLGFRKCFNNTCSGYAFKPLFQATVRTNKILMYWLWVTIFLFLVFFPHGLYVICVAHYFIWVCAKKHCCEEAEKITWYLTVLQGNSRDDSGKTASLVSSFTDVFVNLWRFSFFFFFLPWYSWMR